jgi:hypothetical protein
VSAHAFIAPSCCCLRINSFLLPVIVLYVMMSFSHIQPHMVIMK